MSIGIIGAGYVGRAIGSYFIDKGHNVVFYDVDGDVVRELRSDGLPATDDIADVVNMKYLFFNVPTPTDENGKQILDYVLDALNKVVQLIKRNREREHVIIIKSTVLPGSMEKFILPEIYGHLDSNKVGVIYSPEFITESHSTWIEEDKYMVSPENEYRLVIGEGEEKRWGDMLLEELYVQISVPVIRTDYKTAEFIKYASNNALAVKISYWNEVFLICQELGIDSTIVAKAVSLDPRIGVYGTVHGKAFGGKCLPKDLKAFVNFAKKHREIPLHEAALHINEYMKEKYGVRE